jgi:primary-amine oxidase
MARRSAPARVLLAVAVAGVLASASSPLHASNAASGSFPCSATFKVDQTLPSGGRWQMCWEERAIEGIVLHDVTYTPPGGAAVLVLAQANLATLHVPYDDNGARFYDETDYGLGGGNLQDLTSADCPGGTLLLNGSKHDLCMKRTNRGYEYKSYSSVAQGTQLDLFSVSAIGTYNYVVAWHFQDDGAIRPEIGATGQLERYGGTTATGWPVGGGRIAVAHFHNYYWRLDFDLAGATGDKVQQLAAVPNATRDQWTTVRTTLTTETAANVDPATSRSWRVIAATKNTDGHAMSYELLPGNTTVFHGPAYEPFTRNEVYVTVYAPCEQFVAHNPTTGGCPSDITGFVNGQTLTGADIVVWYGLSFHHLPRDEDETHMGAHWSSFTIQPRDLTAKNPIP